MTNKVFFGDCRDIMKQLISDGVKVQTCVTSPPYWGLRDYGVPGQLGLEKTPEEFTANMVEVFRLVRDLLTDDGTLWLNLGDTYFGSWGNYGDAGGGQRNKQTERLDRKAYADKTEWRPPTSFPCPGLKPKDLAGIPWMVAFALRADGWYLRSDIIWYKPNPMPESVTDRPTKAHEYLFLLSKNERYYYDFAAIKEQCQSGPSDIRKMEESKERIGGKHKGLDDRLNKASIHTNIGTKRAVGSPQGRNKRTVWRVATVPYPGSHFATFPPALIEPCILAGSRPGDICLDPFFGSGTTGQVAESLGRKWLGIELNQEYEPLQKERTAQCGLELG